MMSMTRNILHGPFPSLGSNLNPTNQTNNILLPLFRINSPPKKKDPPTHNTI